MSKERPTMKDVAEYAHVSQPTVSYVINGTYNVTDDVRERVQEAIRVLNYRPNIYARALKTNRTNIYGILVPDLNNTYYSQMVDIALKMLREKGFSVSFFSTDYNPEMEERYAAQMLDYNLDGILILYELTSEKAIQILKNSNVRTIVIEGGKKCSDFPCVNADDYYGGYKATMYLLNQGRKNIAYVDQVSDNEALRQRLRGYTDAMQCRKQFREDLIFRTKSAAEKWEEGIRLGQLLGKKEIDGIVVSADLIAIGILKELLTAGRSIPKDIAVVGYDDVPVAKLFVPALSTMQQPIKDMCSRAVEMLLSKDEPEKLVVLKPQLLIRETSY